MKIQIDLPEDIARTLENRWGDISQYALELLAVEAYRSGTPSAEQLHRYAQSANPTRRRAVSKEPHVVAGFSPRSLFFDI
jgi:hypothetical protein